MRKKHKNTAENTVIQSFAVDLNSFLVKKEATDNEKFSKKELKNETPQKQKEEPKEKTKAKAVKKKTKSIFPKIKALISKKSK